MQVPFDSKSLAQKKESKGFYFLEQFLEQSRHSDYLYQCQSGKAKLPLTRNYA
jgi:hypothetical protein